MIDVHELEHAMKDFAYIAAQKDIEEWQQWEEWNKSAKITVNLQKDDRTIDVTEVFGNPEKRIFSRHSVFPSTIEGRK